MKYLFYIALIAVIVYSCGSTTKTVDTKQTSEEEAVVIANDSLEYEIIIYDIGFSTYLLTIAKPMNFHSQDYLEIKNNFYVTEWNIRANNPIRYGDLYGNKIDYSTHVDYGLEVNYKLYNYFKFFEKKYGVHLK
ncbi:MAG: hypothetical protein KUG51_00990 [Urechidicola sp.]|nr:hypothetical protein [Urechidicola sp.]